MKVWIALCRSKETGFDEPILVSQDEEYTKKELRVFVEFNATSSEWDVNTARIEPAWMKNGK